MFARLTIIQVKRDRIDEALKLYEESVIPAAKSQKGFQGVYVLTDRKTGKAITITMWDDEEDALDNERNLYYQEQVAKFITFFTVPPIREGYEVSLQAKMKSR